MPLLRDEEVGLSVLRRINQFSLHFSDNIILFEEDRSVYCVMGSNTLFVKLKILFNV